MKNRTWCYEESCGEIFCSETITDKEILEDRWDWWKKLMIKKHGANSKLITKENCIRDWVVDNYAWELKDDV